MDVQVRRVVGGKHVARQMGSRPRVRLRTGYPGRRGAGEGAGLGLPRWGFAFRDGPASDPRISLHTAQGDAGFLPASPLTGAACIRRCS